MIKKISITLRKTNNTYLFHDYKKESAILMETCNILIDKVNELVDKVNELEKR